MEIVDIYNKKSTTDCLGCAIRDGKFTPPGGVICKTKHFCVNQDCEISIPGFIIVSSKRHILSIDEFTRAEQKDFIELVVRSRRGMRQALDIQQIDIIMVENGEHHFHVWLLPIDKTMEEKFGTGIKAIKPMMNYAKENMKTPENIKLVEEYVVRLRDYVRNSNERTK